MRSRSIRRLLLQLSLLLVSDLHVSAFLAKPIHFVPSRRFDTPSVHSISLKATTVFPPLTPPYPNGVCGGRLLTIPSEELYSPTETGFLEAVRNPTTTLSGVLLPPRPIQVWLPPSYETTSRSKRYRVLYVHDGQNALEDESSWTGYSWRLAGAVTRLAERHLLDATDISSQNTVDPVPILVLLPSAEDDWIPGVRRRHLEYGDPSGPFAQAHVNFVTQRVIPVVQDRFRTVTDHPAATSVMGTSLGGQASFNLLVQRPDLFGGAAGLSPAFHPTLMASMATSALHLKTKRLYLDNGGDENEIRVPFIDVLDHTTSTHWWNPGYFWLDTQLQPSIDAMKMTLDLMGVNYKYQKFAGERHNERAWAKRITEPLVHLLGRHER